MFGINVYVLLIILTELFFSYAFLTTRLPYSRSMINRMADEEVTVTPKSSLPPLLTNEIAVMEIRTGKIIDIENHPEADGLYVEKVDCGEESPRTIVSGLVEFCSAEELMNKEVIVLCNLKPRALKGITSAGMLLCASNADHTKVVPLSPPSGTTVGELISFDGYSTDCYAEPGNKASKVFSKIAEHLSVNDDMLATFKDIPFMTSQGPIVSSLKGSIS